MLNLFVDGSPDSLGYKPLNLGYISNIKISTKEDDIW